jgi:hypothetical protein
VEYTPQLLGSVTNPTIGTNGYVSGRWRRVGDSVEIQATASRGTSGGSNGSGEYYITLPQGMVADLTKLSGIDNVGTGYVLDGLVLAYTGVAVIASDGFRLSVVIDQTGNLISNNIPSAGWWTSTGLNFFTVKATLPIQGWSSSVKMSDGYDGREILVGLSGGTASVPHNTSQKITGINIDTKSKDTTASWDTTNSRFIVPVSGFYKFSAHGSFVSNGSATACTHAIRLNVNGAFYSDITRRDSIAAEVQNTSSFTTGQTNPLYLVAGDIIEFHAYQNSGVTRTFNGGTFSIERISSPQTIAMGEVVAGFATHSNGQVIPNATSTTLTGWDVVSDTHAIFNPSTGILTVNRSGFLDMSVSIHFFNNTNGTRYVEIYKNNTTRIKYTEQAPIGVYWTSISVAFNGLPVKAGDTFKVNVFQTSGGNLAIGSPSPDRNHVSWRIY